MVEEFGVGYRGNFTVNPTFDLKESETIRGHATAEGTAAYAKRAALVHPSNFKRVKVTNGEEPLTLSKIIFGTDQEQIYDLPDVPQQDFFQYMNIRSAVLSGGINHIDTGHFFRCHRAEHTVGKALQTLHRKFGLQREEVFITSK